MTGFIRDTLEGFSSKDITNDPELEQTVSRINSTLMSLMVNYSRHLIVNLGVYT